MEVVDHIFKSYDIRGRYPDEVNADLAREVGNRLVGLVNAEKVLVLHDARVSGPELTKAVTAGIVEAGATALVAGLGPTDLFYYGCATLDCPGIMITASHNPPDQNGFKIVRKMPFALSLDEGLSELRRRIKEEPSARKEGGMEEHVELEAGFVEYMAHTIGEFRMPRVAVVDAGNGASGLVMVKLRDRLNMSCDVINYDPDGRFPNRGPNPTEPGALKMLADEMLEDHAVVGAAMDGDGDRAVIMDHDGNVIPGDFVAALLARHALQRKPGAPAIYDVRCSRAVRDFILQEGGKPLVNRVGHVYMKKRLSEEGAAFAGELSGHYYFPEFFGADSGLLAAIYMIKMASEMGDGWNEQLQTLRQNYHVSGEINFPVADASERLDHLRQKFSHAQISEIDGVTFDLGDWWFNVRSSNTEPLLRLNLEASSQDDLHRHLDEVTPLLK
ncbi:MAG: phosphomannomutase/phosphoglucomutase [Armatimonadota bacterium]|nr:phosphomannomutase/phosphoglucomutase [Armatimonadota bacterium]